MSNLKMLHESETNHGKCGKTWYIIPYVPNGTGIFTYMNGSNLYGRCDVGKYFSPIRQILGKFESLQCIFQPRENSILVDVFVSQNIRPRHQLQMKRDNPYRWPKKKMGNWCYFARISGAMGPYQKLVGARLVCPQQRWLVHVNYIIMSSRHLKST